MRQQYTVEIKVKKLVDVTFDEISMIQYAGEPNIFEVDNSLIQELHVEEDQVAIEIQQELDHMLKVLQGRQELAK